MNRVSESVTITLLAAIFLLSPPGQARSAQATPPIESQTGPPPTAPAQPGSQLEIPPATPPEFSPGQNVLTLPPVFRGCWRGTAPTIDSLTPLGPRRRIIEWLAKSYVFCYQRGGPSDRWQLTFGEGKVVDNALVRGQNQWVKVESVAGADHARLQAYLGFYTFERGAWSRKDEWTDLDCRAAPEGATMEVRARVYVRIDGEPAVLLTWHARFHRSAA